MSHSRLDANSSAETAGLGDGRIRLRERWSCVWASDSGEQVEIEGGQEDVESFVLDLAALFLP
jgi:hypothetical protein